MVYVKFFAVPLLCCGLFSHGEGLSINHHACSMRVADFRLYSPGFLKMFSFTFNQTLVFKTMKLLIKFPDGVYNGIKITVKGNIPSNAVRFAINLLCGSSTIEPEDIAFHLCPRFKEGRVVRNSRSHKEFKDEESAGGNPLSPGTAVEIEIECTDSAFKVKLNGNNFCEFKHRLPFDRITHLDVDGDLKLSHISF